MSRGMFIGVQQCYNFRILHGSVLLRAKTNVMKLRARNQEPKSEPSARSIYITLCSESLSSCKVIGALTLHYIRVLHFLQQIGQTALCCSSLSNTQQTMYTFGLTASRRGFFVICWIIDAPKPVITNMRTSPRTQLNTFQTYSSFKLSLFVAQQLAWVIFVTFAIHILLSFSFYLPIYNVVPPPPFSSPFAFVIRNLQRHCSLGPVSQLYLRTPRHTIFTLPKFL